MHANWKKDKQMSNNSATTSISFDITTNNNKADGETRNTEVS